MYRTRSVSDKHNSKMAYGHLIRIIFMITANTVKTLDNIMAVKKYNKYGVIPEYIEDSYGKKIYFERYGQKVPGGWEADHILSKNKVSGSNDISNLQALNWKDNISKSDNIDFLDKKIHYYFKSINRRVNYANNIRSLRKIKEGNVYRILCNTRVINDNIGVVISKSKKYILVSFNKNQPIKVYPDPELFREI